MCGIIQWDIIRSGCLKVTANPYPVLINGTKTDISGYNINGGTYLKLIDLKRKQINPV